MCFSLTLVCPQEETKLSSEQGEFKGSVTEVDSFLRPVWIRQRREKEDARCWNKAGGPEGAGMRGWESKAAVGKFTV